jgi:hypothetical protein
MVPGMALKGRLALPDAAAGRRHARQRFDWSAIARGTRAVYEAALHG